MKAKELETLLEQNNTEYGTNFYLGGTYGQYDLWAKTANGEYRLESGSVQDCYNAFVKYRFNEKYRTKKEAAVNKTADEDYRGSMKKFKSRHDYADYLVGLMGAESVLNQLVMAMGDSEAFSNFDYIARMNDIDFNNEEGVVEGSKKTAEYNGYKNYETWNVALWLDNDQGTQEMVHEWANEARAGAAEHENTKEGIWSADETAKFTLGEQIKNYVEEQNPLAEAASMYTDLLGAAISEVDWDEIAGNILSTYAEISADEQKKQDERVAKDFAN